MVKRIQAPASACLGCAVALIFLVVLAYKVGVVEHLDAAVVLRFGAEPGTAAFAHFESLAHLADPMPLALAVAAICGLGALLGQRREALAALAVVAGANLTTQVLKVLLAHPRFQPLLGDQQPWTTAFPSGHATAAASIAVALVLVAPPRLRLPAATVGVAFAGLIGVSVVVLQWHYPTDVLGGTLVAAGWGFAALAALRLVGPFGPRSSRLAIFAK